MALPRPDRGSLGDGAFGCGVTRGALQQGLSASEASAPRYLQLVGWTHRIRIVRDERVHCF